MLQYIKAAKPSKTDPSVPLKSGKFYKRWVDMAKRSYYNLIRHFCDTQYVS